MTATTPTAPLTAPPAATTVRGRLVRVGRVLTASAVRGVATGAGTAVGGWVAWWITHR